MKSKTLLIKTFLFAFQILFISSSVIVENNQDLVDILNSFAKEIAELKLVKHDIEIKLTSIQSKMMSKLKYENFPKYTILTVGSEEIFNYFTIRLLLGYF